MLPQVFVGDTHWRQVVPGPPHSVFEVPARQVWERESQQPPAQVPQLSVPPHPSGTLPHCVPQDALVHPQTLAVPPPPQVLGDVQLLFDVQPQVPPGMHAVPAGELVQLTQLSPGAPQVAGCMSAV
jgi:hypothetical protein